MIGKQRSFQGPEMSRTRALIKAMGYTDEELARPRIGVNADRSVDLAYLSLSRGRTVAGGQKSGLRRSAWRMSVGAEA